MFGVPTLLAACAATALAVPALVFGAESLSSLLPSRKRSLRDAGARPRIAVLVPAHDEELNILRTVTSLRAELADGDRLVVVADNCSDRTAERAREAGAEVVERADPDRRGKGFALSYGARYLDDDPPEVVIVMDADCRVERGTLSQLAALAAETGRPAQAVYLMHAARDGASLSSVSAFAFLVRNLVRPTGLARLGLPCQLTGTGMAFPWVVFRDAPPTESFLVEDLLLGHELALLGTAPLLCDDVIVGSDLPTSEAASLRQRRRWEHGDLTVLLRTAPRLLLAGIMRRDAGLVALGLDASVPPLALLVVCQASAVAGGTLLAVLGGSPLPLLFALGGGAVMLTGLTAAWLIHGRGVLPLSDLAKIPSYVLWKLPLYGSFVRRGPHAEWERTERA